MDSLDNYTSADDFKDKLQTVEEVERDEELTNHTFRDGWPDSLRSDFKTCLCAFDCARG